MILRRWLVLALAIALAAPAAASPIQVKFSTLAPEGSGWINTWYRVVEYVERESPVPVKVVSYPGGVMGDEPDMVRKLKFDQLQVVGVTVAGISQMVPEILVLGLPFLFENYAEVDHVIAKLFPTFQQIAEAKGYYLLALLDQGMIELYSRQPIRNLKEYMAGKVWTWNANPVHILSDRAVGIRGTPITVPELLPALQTGLVDVVSTSPAALVSLQWHTQVRYRVPVELRYEPAAIIASKRIENKVAADKRDAFRAVLEKAAATILPPFLTEQRRDEADMRKLLAEAGIKDTPWSAADIAELRTQSQKTWALAVEQGLFPQSLLDQVKAELAAFRAAKGGTK